MTLVVGYDESPGADRALVVAIDLAHRLDEPIVVVYGASPPGRVGEEYGEHLRALESMGHRAVEHALEVTAAGGVRAEVEVLQDRPTDALLDAAERHQATMIVVGSYGESPLRGALLGSTPHRLLHLASHPVLVVPG
jgi:nucleotide-binding universal stress UspA family protein